LHERHLPRQYEVKILCDEGVVNVGEIEIEIEIEIKIEIEIEIELYE
jgi:hypothetical protein